MFKNLVKESIHEMHTDVKIIRLTFLTSFFHSLIAIFLIILNLNSLIAKNYDNGLYVGKVAEYVVQEINANHFVTIVIIITSSLFLLYSIIYPIGQAAIIHRIHNKASGLGKGNIKDALKKGLQDFFAFFEYSAISMPFLPAIFFLTIFKVIILDGHINPWTIALFALWRLVMSAVNTLKAYTKYCITLEGLSLGDALKRSFQLAKKNYKNSQRYMRVQTILLISFSINLLLALGIPIVLMYLAIKYDFIQILGIKIIVYILFGIMTIFAAYMSSIIRAFFAYYWYKLYNNIKND